jgi:hypothetical protein
MGWSPWFFLTPFRKFDDILGHAALGLAGDLQLNLDGPQDLAGLRGNGISTIWHDVFVLQIGQSFPKDIFQATGR